MLYSLMYFKLVVTTVSCVTNCGVTMYEPCLGSDLTDWT